MLDQNCQENINKFAAAAIGVPFVDRGRELSGWDCWGLVLAAYREVFALALPDGAYSCTEPQAAGAALKQGAAAWQEIALGLEQPFDVLLLRPCHAALVLAPGKMLHVREGQATCLDRYLAPMWRPALLGIYRHAQLA